MQGTHLKTQDKKNRGEFVYIECTICQIDIALTHYTQ